VAQLPLARMGDAIGQRREQAPDLVRRLKRLRLGRSSVIRILLGDGRVGETLGRPGKRPGKRPGSGTTRPPAPSAGARSRAVRTMASTRPTSSSSKASARAQAALVRSGPWRSASRRSFCACRRRAHGNVPRSSTVMNWPD
jgi:hypothetical protein